MSGPEKAAEEVAHSSWAWVSTAQGELGVPGEGKLIKDQGSCNTIMVRGYLLLWILNGMVRAAGWLS